MNIEFQYQNPIHHFNLTGELNASDLTVLRDSLYRLYESNPAYVVIDVSRLETGLLNPQLESVLKEIQCLATAKNQDFYVAQTALEASSAFSRVLEQALDKRARIAQGKQEVLKQMKEVAAELTKENIKLKSVLQNQRAAR